MNLREVLYISIMRAYLYFYGNCEIFQMGFETDLLSILNNICRFIALAFLADRTHALKARVLSGPGFMTKFRRPQSQGLGLTQLPTHSNPIPGPSV